MKKKIDIEDTKTKVIILIISIALIIAIVSITSYHFMIKSKLPISNASKEEIEDIEEIKLPEGMLYHIVYLTNNITNITYDILIDENYNISMTSKVDSKESILNDKHTQVDFLDNNQKEWLINYLNNLDYPHNLDEEIKLENSNYIISNYGLEKRLINVESENYLLDIIINSLITKNATYYDYLMKDNNVTNYIIDTNYQKLDINDTKVIDLYNKIVPVRTLENHLNDEVYDSYKINELSNNTIISLTLNSFSIEEMFYNCIDDDEGLTKICFVDNNLFDEKLKNIFGNISYDISIYNGYDTSLSCCFGYDKERNQLFINHFSGDELDDCLFTNIDYAYQVDDKLVIIEKTLYYILYDSNHPDYGTEEYYQQSLEEVGVYESIDKKILIPTLDISLDDYEEALNELEPFVTYYAHTFTLSDDGNYYYTNIDRLN